MVFDDVECYFSSVTDELAAPTGLAVIRPDEWGPDLGLVPAGSWREIVGPSRGALRRSFYDVTIEAGGVGRALTHPGEAVYYVVDGPVTLVEQVAGGALRSSLDAGSMVHVPAGSVYSFESQGGGRLVGGPSPVDPEIGLREPVPADESRIAIHHRDRPGLMVPFISNDARLVVWLGAGAETANMNYVVLEPGERNKEHVHAISEDTIHILEGHGTAENVTTGEKIGFGPGDTVHIEVGFWHAVAADRGERVISVGGPCPADTDMLRAAPRCGGRLRRSRMATQTSSVMVALAQIDVRAGQVDHNRDMALAHSRTAFDAGAELVVLPELAISGYVVDPEVLEKVAEPLDGPTLAAVSALAGERGGLVAYGFCERVGADFFNTVVLVSGEGPQLHYRKLHLFDREKLAYSPGDLGLPVADTACGRLGVCICYDLRFVEVLRAMSLRGAELVLAPAAWVAGFDRTVPSSGATQHVDGVIAQANLDQVAVVAVSQVAGAAHGAPATLGGSVAVDAYGEVLAGPLSRTEPDSALVEVDLDAVRSARVRSDLIRPRDDRRTDVYGVGYGGESL
jgi:N-carbamoylputrescine amidase